MRSRKRSHKRSQTKRRSRAKSSRTRLIREYERLLFQPILSTNHSSPTPTVSKHELVKRATYHGYSWNGSRRTPKAQLERFLTNQNVSDTIPNPFQKICGPSKRSIAYPIIYTKDELIRMALDKGHPLDSLSRASVPHLWCR